MVDVGTDVRSVICEREHMCDRCSGTQWHKQVKTVTKIAGQPQVVEVDEGMRELLPLLWSRGIETQYSCQGGAPSDTKAYILFTNAVDSVDFFRTTALLAAKQGHCPELSIETIPGLDQ